MPEMDHEAHQSSSIREARPDTPDEESRLIRLDGSANEIRALLDVEHGVPLGESAEVLEATLHLFKAAASPGAATLTVEPLDGAWDAQDATWNNAPDVRASSETAAIGVGGLEGDEITVDVTAMIADAVAVDDASGDRFYGFRLKIDDDAEHLLHSAFSDSDYRPVLTVAWAIPPESPEDLKPSGGRVISETLPELVATFVDDDADDVISAIQVRIDNDPGMGSLLYDSTKVAHNEARFDLDDPPAGAAAPAALPEDTVLYWQMQLWDGADLPSGWSDVASFMIVAKGALTLDNPAGDTVDSPTPAIEHTLADGDQDQVEVLVEILEDGVWEEHWFLPRAVDASTSHVIPDDFRLVEGETYRVTVRVWDDVDREDIAGDRSFYEARQVFTLDAVSVAP